MQQMGLYEKFSSETPILLEFRSYLTEYLEAPRSQQEVSPGSEQRSVGDPTETCCLVRPSAGCEPNEPQPTETHCSTSHFRLLMCPGC